MRIGLVIGRICLQPLYETLVGFKEIGSFQHGSGATPQQLRSAQAETLAELVEAGDECIVELNKNLFPRHVHMVNHMSRC